MWLTYVSESSSLFMIDMCHVGEKKMQQQQQKSDSKEAGKAEIISWIPGSRQSMQSYVLTSLFFNDRTSPALNFYVSGTPPPTPHPQVDVTV